MLDVYVFGRSYETLRILEVVFRMAHTWSDSDQRVF